MPIPRTISGAKLLRECCVNRTPAAIIGDEKTYWGSFLHFDVDLLLELLPCADPSFVPSSVHAVCFGEPPKSFVLLATIKQYDAGSRQLLLTSLSPITKLERRRFDRLQVPVNCGLVIQIDRGGQQWAPKPLDLSMGGVRVQFPIDRVTELEVGAAVDVTLKLGHQAAELPAKVARQDKDSFGLEFLQPVPRSLQRIYELLGRGTPKTQIS
jgi:hypothetical protein